MECTRCQTEFASLSFEGLHNLRMAVSLIECGISTQHIKIFLALNIPDPNTLATTGEFPTSPEEKIKEIPPEEWGTLTDHIEKEYQKGNMPQFYAKAWEAVRPSPGKQNVIDPTAWGLIAYYHEKQNNLQN